MIENKVLLVGNGINSIVTAYKWKNLIDDLISYSGAAGQININDKPFPLLYEEIFLEGAKNRKLKEEDLKEYIAKKVAEIKHNEIHEKIMNLKFKNVLTTNYDYTLEISRGLKKENLKNEGVINESAYSLFRNMLVNDIRIWHIHGECNYSKTITLGYEHYSGYLQQMRNYVVTGTGSSYKKTFEALNKRLEAGDINFDSWIDFFFTKNIYIIGFTLDFVEIHLWWLLTYRARRKFTEKARINNEIIYYYPENIANDIKNKLELLRANDVTPYSIRTRTNNISDYYFKVLDKVEKN